MRRERVGMWWLLWALSVSACGGSASHLVAPPSEEAQGRMTAESALERVHAALADVPEVVALRERIEASGGRLVVMLEGDADPSVDRPRVWQVYVGEERPDHLVRLWAFNVDATSGAMTITDPVTMVDVPYDRWRQELTASPP